jgi:hypothetical protein
MPFYASHVAPTNGVGGSFLTPAMPSIRREIDGAIDTHAEFLPPVHGPVFAARSFRLSPAMNSHCGVHEAWS